jgi:hypothetical protein
VVGCSTIRFDSKLVKDAAGEVVALNVADGKVRWRKDVPGGVLSRVAVAGDTVVFTATDGKVRAWSLASGAEKWAFENKQPFFAGAAVADATVYVADLKAVLHALRLADGKPLWHLDVPADPEVLVAGMVFGTPLARGGKIYLTTCNLDAAAVDLASAVVCVSEKRSAITRPFAPGLVIDREKRTITIPSRIAPRKLATLKEIYPLEVVACYPTPRGQKAHETVVTFEVKPSDVHKAIESFGLKPGKPARGDEGTASGPEVRLYLELPGVTDKPRLVPLEKTMIDARTGKPLPPLKWLFTGSVMKKPDPDKDMEVYGADLGGTMVTIFPVTDETVFQTDLNMRDCRLLKLETNRNVVPEIGTAVKLVIEVK